MSSLEQSQHASEYKRYQPVNVNQRHKEKLNPLDRFGVVITRVVGTMITAILFTVLALISLPAAIKTHDKIIIVAWVAQTFLQLVLLPIIMVGQNIQGKHAETLADEEYKTTQTTYKDLENLILVNQKQLDLLVNLSRAHQA
jgi:predicted cobalt transporter CbtA